MIPMKAALFLVLLCGFCALPLLAQGAGTIEGTIKVEVPPPDPDADPVNELENVVIYLDGFPAGTTFAPPTTEGSMRQRKKHFMPYILPIQVGSKVRFPNDDDLFHNVFSLSKTMPFDIGQYPKGPGLSLQFNKVGRVRVFCKIHSFMKANILVLPSPHFTQPGADGKFRLENVPAGSYFVVAWHEHLKQDQTKVAVEPGKTVTTNFTIR
jgi:plastocyanin